MSSSLNDLLRDIAAGDRAAFERLYDATEAKLFGVCLRILKDKGPAEDALQETYINIWRRAGGYTPTKASAISWLSAIARNASIDLLRQRRADHDDIDSKDIVEESANPEQSAMAMSDARRLEDCLGELRPQHADFIRSAYFSGFTYEEMSERFETPVGTIKSAISRSLLRLRDCFNRAPDAAP